MGLQWLGQEGIAAAKNRVSGRQFTLENRRTDVLQTNGTFKLRDQSLDIGVTQRNQCFVLQFISLTVQTVV